MQTIARRVLIEHLGRFEPGAKLPPIRQLAHELSLGQSNLYGALRELAGEGIVYSRRRLGTFLAQDIRSSRQPTASGEVPDKTRAATLIGRRVAVLSSPHADALFGAIARAASAELRSAGVSVVEGEMASELFPRFDSADVPELAILVNPPLGPLPKGPGYPAWIVVSTSWFRRGAEPLDCDLVGVDQEGGGFLAGELFRKMRVTPAGFAGRALSSNPTVYDEISRRRLRGFQEGLGREVAPDHLLDSRGYSPAAGGRAFRRYAALRPRPRAVFVASDDIAIGFLAAAAAEGLEAGRDFHIVGFDGQSTGRRLPEGALTTVEVPGVQMARTAATMAKDRLLNLEQGFQVTQLSCRLLLGETTGPLHKRPDSPRRRSRRG